jgi:NAD(P)-dependent dehydrogenase (short-subunit alcohol dehydrogenase family)
MLSLRDKNMVVIGGSRGAGRRIVEAVSVIARACLR